MLYILNQLDYAPNYLPGQILELLSTSIFDRFALNVIAPCSVEAR